MEKKLTIFSLAEYVATLNAIWNHLGWAPQSSRGLHGFPKGRPMLSPEIETATLAKVKEEGVTLVIKHIFKPFKKAEPEHYMRGYFDDALRLLKLLIREQVSFVIDMGNDQETKEELERLFIYSPPLYERLFPKRPINN